MPRFVILRHDPGGSYTRDFQRDACQPHWDWMFETDQTLRTWSTPPLSDLGQSFCVEAKSLADHRLAYLEYEGEVSGNRGWVKRIFSGQYEQVKSSDDRLECKLRACRHGGEATTPIFSASVVFQRKLEDEDRVRDACAVWQLRFSRCR